MKFSILGCDINNLNSHEETYRILIDYLHLQNKPTYITVNNVHTVTEGIKNKDFRNIINNSFLSLPDGKPLSVVGKLKGIKNINRIFGPDFFEKTIDWGQENNLKHFFFGSANETLQKLSDKIKIKFPNAKIVGMISPSFNEFTAEENEKYIREIKASNPDLIWVSLGAPKQEKWISNNYKKLDHGVMVGIGAGFDYLSGNLKNAPLWMKNFSLEWLYRLMQEPKRLWKRYFFSNTIFIFYIILDFLGLKKIH